MDLDEVALTVAVLQKIRPKKEFEREVCAYMAAVARSNGAVFLPEELFPACAQEKLDEMNNDLHLKGKVKSLWESGKRAHDDAAIGHQLGMLKEVEEYLVPHGLGKADPTNKEL
jgi:hypothetical protein